MNRKISFSDVIEAMQTLFDIDPWSYFSVENKFQTMWPNSLAAYCFHELCGLSNTEIAMKIHVHESTVGGRIRWWKEQGDMRFVTAIHGHSLAMQRLETP